MRQTEWERGKEGEWQGKVFGALLRAWGEQPGLQPMEPLGIHVQGAKIGVNSGKAAEKK